MLQIDCVTPFQGTPEEFAETVCSHLNAIDTKVDVRLQEIKNTSVETVKSKQQVSFMVLQLNIDEK